MGGQAAEGFVVSPAKVAGVGHSGDVVRLYVLPHVTPGTFFSTNVANSRLAKFRQIDSTDCHH